MKSRRRVKVAVVGAGRLGSAHARVYAKLPSAALLAVCDVDPAAAERAAEETGAKAVLDYRNVPDEVEAVSIAVPTALHKQVAEYFLGKGKSVLVEKPLAPRAAEAEDIVKAAREASRRAGATLHVGHVERFNPAVRAALPYLKRPRFIETKRVAPFSFRSKDIGVVFDLMIHDLDLVLAIVGEEPVAVEAAGVAVLLDHEDVANARLVFPSGCVADMTASRVAAKVERAFRVFNDSCYVSIDTLTPRARLFKKSEKLTSGELDVSKLAPDQVGDPKKFLFEELIDLVRLPLPEERPLNAELGSFVEAVASESRSVASGEDAVKAIRVAEKILEKIEKAGRRLSHCASAPARGKG